MSVNDNVVFIKVRHLTACRFLIFFSAIFFISSILQAETSPDIKRFTIQREKTPVPDETSSDITRFTIQREKTPEIDSASPNSIELSEVEVNERGGNFQIKVVAVIDAPARYVRYVLTDYSHLYRLNPSITESVLLKQNDDGTANVRTRIDGCAAYFCEELNMVENVQLLPSGEIYAEIVPEHGEFKSGKTYWQIKALGERTEVTYRSNMKPDIYIPPVVSKFLVKKAIKEEAATSFANLQRISSDLCSGLDAETGKLSVCN